MASLGRYRNPAEKAYDVKRAEVLDTVGTDIVANAPFLMATRALVSEMAVRYELFSMIKNVSGAIVECGVNFSELNPHPGAAGTDRRPCCWPATPTANSMRAPSEKKQCSS